ncbi:MAG TPA: calcium/proton exchanger [Candidatus Limnocylindrales bacterium]|nr:calcium/proton exchanger [Candidatus Limnocylindrales bacterium]
MSRASSIPAMLGRSTSILLVVGVAATVATATLRVAGAGSVAVFVVAAVALAGLAGLVGAGTDQLGQRLGPGATGVLQSALGNLPELFISLFALRAGLVVLVQTALIGSILANSLLVLGLAFVAGGVRNGVQRFGTQPIRMIATLLVLAVAALAIPTVATAPGGPDVGHARDLSVICAVVLLVVFAASIPFSIGGGPGASAVEVSGESRWPMPLALGILGGAGLGAAFVSEWFVDALKPAMGQLGLSEAFVGLVIVAIAGNAVENVVGIQMAIRNRTDLAISLILNSSLQVALAMTPALVLASVVIGGPALTLVLSPLLLSAVTLAAILAALVVYDGESTWLEGMALVGLYVIIAASVWWGPPVGA